ATMSPAVIVTWLPFVRTRGMSFYFVTPLLASASGGPAGDQLFRTQDGARTWARQQVESGASVRQRYLLPHFDNPREGVLPVVSAGSAGTQVAFFRTSDGGQHWQRSAVVPVTSERSAGATVPLSVLSTNRWLLAVPNRARLLDA